MIVFNAIFPVAVIAGIGFIWGKKKPDTNIGWLADIIVYLGSPSLIFSAIIKASFTWKSFALVFSSAMFAVFIGWLLASLVFQRLLGHKQQGATLPIIFINSGNLGLSLSYFAFGEAGLSIAVIFHTAMFFLVFSLGIFLLTKDEHVWTVFKYPHLYICVLAILLNFYQLQVPLAVFRTIELMGQITIPLMLLLLGIQLSGCHYGKSWKIAITGAALRLTAGLLASALFIILFSIEGIMARVIILLMALPSAVMTQTLTEKHNKDSELCSSIIAVSTVSSLFYIPILLYLLTK
ncbi:AEC family transporter [Candidatus Margulisiibacteriota bacterium]